VQWFALLGSKRSLGNAFHFNEIVRNQIEDYIYKMKSMFTFIKILFVIGFISLFSLLIYGMDHYKKVSVKHKFGTKVDSFNGVNVYYNGKVSNISGRNLTSDGYNLGLKYQCVEFVKRYYYEHLNHKMPNSYGNAKDFFNPRLKDGQMNHDRKLIQYTNGGQSLPKPNDILIFGSTPLNKFGHVAIVSKVGPREIEIIQQNPGIMGSSRETFRIVNVRGASKVDHSRILGWLRKK
jgi:surface antigen